MVRIIQSGDLTPDTLTSQTDKDHCYNCLDCCVTLEVLEALLPLLDETTQKTYDLSLALQGPILEMNIRGVLLDGAAVEDALEIYESGLQKIERNFNRIMDEVYNIQPEKKTTIWNSPQKLMRLFYELMRLPPVKKRNAKGMYTPTVNREALESLSAKYWHAKPLVAHILAMRDLGKKISYLSTEIDRDGRIRTSFNIAGTSTGRLASSMSEFGTGTNLQNVDRRLRRTFIPDPNFKFINIDLEQADARNVGAIIAVLFDDYTFLNACESGDLHTTVCKLAWNELPWTGDPKQDRAIANQIAYRDLSYRDLSKKLGHGTNYFGSPYTMSRHTKLPQVIVRDFQSKYFKAFPISRWHNWVRGELLRTGCLTTFYHRRRHFFGRRSDDSTLREAIAYCPQSMTADQINLAMLAIWRSELCRMDICQLLLQVHDSLLLQYRVEKEEWVFSRLRKLMNASALLLANKREYHVPCEIKVGWNWADADQDNPQGLIKFDGSHHDSRLREAPQKVSKLDRLLSRSI